MIPVDASIADLAGVIRAETGLRLPDSLIMATGVRANADFVASPDEGLRKAEDHISVMTPEAIPNPPRPLITSDAVEQMCTPLSAFLI